MIGKTALALIAAAVLAATAALFVWAAGFAIFFALDQSVGPALAAAITAGVAALALALVFVAFADRARHKREEKERVHAETASHMPAFLAPFANVLHDKPLVSLGLSMLTGLVATRHPSLLRDVLAAVTVMGPLTKESSRVD